PATPQLRAGSLDLTRFQVAADDAVVRFTLTFRALSDPGWHPEYGFQLTYAAIAIDTDRTPGSGQRTVGRNASVKLSPERAFERIVYVGGGVRVEDGKGTVVAEYLPVESDARSPLGIASTGTLAFSLPVSMVGSPTATWRYTILIGAQDDHGGAGIGDFRAVQRTVGEWHGGGRRATADPNIYDVLLIQ
ncbi:MAG: glucodextranase DOMON-like domain-containing protein, partial [Bacteroidota bacterium]